MCCLLVFLTFRFCRVLMPRVLDWFWSWRETWFPVIWYVCSVCLVVIHFCIIKLSMSCVPPVYRLGGGSPIALVCHVQMSRVR